MNIFVGLSSRLTENKEFNKLADDVGRFIVNGNHNLVFGAYNHGLMGKVYSIVNSSENSDVIAVTCRRFEADLLDISYKEPVYMNDNISGRKDDFYKVSDVLLFIPGGFGTLDELMSAIEAKRNEEHNLPIVIVNQSGFFNNFFNMLEKIYEEGFADLVSKELYVVFENFAKASDYINNISR